MDYKSANRSYLYMIVATIAFSFLYSGYVYAMGSDMPLPINNFLCEMMVFIPGVAVALFHGERLKVLVPFKKIRFSTILFVLIYTVLLFPMVICLNSLSMIFVENKIAGVADQIVSTPMWQMILSVGVLGPFIEEFVFRGILLQTYQRTGRIIGSIILSSVLFGIVHMNFNQLVYAAAMGVMLALLVEATGSVISSFIAHAAFNTYEVLSMYASSDIFQEASDTLEVTDMKLFLLIFALISLLIAVVCIAIDICIAVKISKNEGRFAFFTQIPSCKKGGLKLVTVPLVISLMIAFAYMAGIEFLLNVSM